MSRNHQRSMLDSEFSKKKRRGKKKGKNSSRTTLPWEEVFTVVVIEGETGCRFSEVLDSSAHTEEKKGEDTRSLCSRKERGTCQLFCGKGGEKGNRKSTKSRWHHDQREEEGGGRNKGGGAINIAVNY